MKADLSLVFDERGKVRLNLIEQASIHEIDKYTTTKEDSDEIRKDYEEDIEAYKLEYKDLLEKIPDKRGRIVIIYKTENGSERLLRVLYKKQANKLDMDFVLKKISNVLKNNFVDLTINTIEEHPYIFDSSFAKDRLRKTKRKNPISKEEQKVLVDRVIGDTIINTKKVSFDKSYFYVRKIDSYLERKRGYLTTPIMTSKIKNLEVKKIPKEKTSVVTKKGPLTEDEFMDQLLKNKAKDEVYGMPEIYDLYQEYLEKFMEERNHRR